MKHRSYLFITVLWMMVIPAWAQTVETVVTGQFRPNAANPSNTSFENTTPRGAFCNWRPTECDKAGAYIFDLGTGEFWQKNGDGDNESRRDTTYVRFPAPAQSPCATSEPGRRRRHVSALSQCRCG